MPWTLRTQSGRESGEPRRAIRTAGLSCVRKGSVPVSSSADLAPGGSGDGEDGADDQQRGSQPDRRLAGSAVESWTLSDSPRPGERVAPGCRSRGEATASASALVCVQRLVELGMTRRQFPASLLHRWLAHSALLCKAGAALGRGCGRPSRGSMDGGELPQQVLQAGVQAGASVERRVGRPRKRQVVRLRWPGEQVAAG